MICQARIKIGQTKTGKEKIHLVITPYKLGWPGSSDTPEYPQIHQPELFTGTEECGGKIVASIQAIDEPYYGGHSATLEVEYKCQRCKNQHFPDLPSDSEGLSKWLTEVVDLLPNPTFPPCDPQS